MPPPEITTKPAIQLSSNQLGTLAQKIKQWGSELGFDAVGVSDINLAEHEQHLQRWVDQGMHGSMHYMVKHGSKRSHPEQLVEGTVRVISVRLDYSPEDIDQAHDVLQQPEIGFISRYALGRDYHKVVRKKLQQLAHRINQEIGEFGYRAFTDSAPVLEKALAEKAGLGWIGKHTNLLHSKSGSWFFLGELFVDLALPVDKPASNHCGSCRQCIDACPTGAIIGPYQVDARLCISYLTIELKESIPVELRSKLGNRIYGCDDCQLICPWNKFAEVTREPDFTPREQLTDRKLLDLFAWSEEEFLANTEGTAIRRIGYQAWKRNIATALGNCETSEAVVDALIEQRGSASEMVVEHIDWALGRHQ